MRCVLGLAVICALAVSCAPARDPSLEASSHAGQTRAATTPLLADRLRIALPGEARVVPMPHDLMAAPASDEDETRVVLEDGDERLVVFAEELYALAGADFLGSVRHFLAVADAGAPPRIERVAEVAAPLQAISARPAQPREIGEDTVLLSALYVAQGEGPVEGLTFAVNEAGRRHSERWASVAERIARSVTPGSAALSLAAGPRKLGWPHEAPSLQVTVPAGYAATIQPGPDFIVFHLRRLAPLGELSPALGIYLGDHPQTQQTSEATPAGAVSGTLLGRSVDWSTWTTPSGPGQPPTQWSEARAPVPGQTQVVHVLDRRPERE